MLGLFRHGLTLFGYFETDDLKATQKFLSDNDVNARWSEYMAPIMKVEFISLTINHFIAFTRRRSIVTLKIK